MAFHEARTSSERSATDDAPPIPIDFTFEITDGELRTITAVDDQGQSYVVSIKLTRGQEVTCCCPQPDGRVKCESKPQCNCSPI